MSDSDLLWSDLLSDEKQKTYFVELLQKIRCERILGKKIYPDEKDVFNSFVFTKFSDIKVVILGQDPYHKANQAHGLAFSVTDKVKIPPSLANIYKELESDIPSYEKPDNGCLESWARQGVFLLNTTLTVEEGIANSHLNFGWWKFTNKVIEMISSNKTGIVFLLWGKNAQDKVPLIDSKKHHILKSSHPSPLSAYRGFLGCKHFSKTNDFLLKQGKKTISW